MPTTRIVFAADHTVEVEDRIQEVSEKLCDAGREGWYVSWDINGRRVDINPGQVRCLEMVGDPAEHYAA